MERYIRWFIRNGDYYYFDEKPIHLNGISLDKSSIALTTVGQTEQLTATITPEGAVETLVSWSSSDESVATVDENGLVTCVSVGSCTITASYGGYSATCEVKDKLDVYVDLLVVGGGGGGGSTYYPSYGGGGGGAGGVIQCSGYLLEEGSYNVTVGGGGAGGAPCYRGCDGSYSKFDVLLAYGGGGGGYRGEVGFNGGSGGGGGGQCGGASSGVAGQGYGGGKGECFGAGGGGGAGEAGADATFYWGGKGGDGIQSDISGTCTWYAGGGGGASFCNCARAASGCGGGNCGGGGAGGGQSNCFCSYGYTGKGGVVILRYPTAYGYDISGGCCYTCGDYTIHCFTSNGTLTVN